MVKLGAAARFSEKIFTALTNPWPEIMTLTKCKDFQNDIAIKVNAFLIEIKSSH